MEYATLREKIAAEKAERAAKYEQFQRIVADADDAGMRAAKDCVPRPMVVGTPVSPFGNSPMDTSKPMHYVEDGACGFAWVTISPGTASFSRWAKEHAGFRKAYGGGLQLWVSDFNQSVARKEAYAGAFARVLNEHAAVTGVRAYPGSRLD